MAGAAAVGISPILKAVGTGMSGPFELIEGRGRAVFRLGGRDRWAIDTRRFSGSPKLNIYRSENLIRLSLTHAGYPGTQLPADMTCELRRGIVGWRMKLKMAFGRFEADVPFERWLTGGEPACSKIRVDAVVCPLGEKSLARAAGNGEAEFRPDWTLSLKGDRIARIDGLGGVVSDSLVVSIPPAKAPGIAARPCPRRTLITLRRGRRSWRLEPYLPRPDGWTFTGSRTAFDRIIIEADENSLGLAERSLIAESADGSSGLTFSPVSAVNGIDDRPFEIPLSNPRYAVSFDPTGDHKALVAGYGTEPFWLHTDGCSVQMGDSPDVAPFEITSRGDKVEGTYCAPALLCVVAPLIGAVAEPTKPTSGTTIQIPAGKIKRVPPPSNTSSTTQTPTTRGTTQPSTGTSKPTIRVPLPKVRVPVRKPSDGKVIVRPDLKKEPVVKVPMNLTVSVIRPDDLLSLKFEFINLNLQAGGGNAKLVKADKSKPAYIVVHFPPQSIAERAYREGEPGTSDGETPAAPPVPSVMAGPSRLSFLAPSNVNEIPYNLESLLGWASYQQSVAPVALPPPPKPERAEIIQAARKRAIEDTSDLKAVHAALFGDPNVRIFHLNKNIHTDVMTAKPRIQPPELHHTAIEVPYRLILSPSVYAGWAHSVNVVTREGRTELWHTRLGVRGQDGVDEDEDYYRTLRAIWSPDYKPEAPPNGDYPFPMDISTRDRHQIVALTSDYITVSGREPEPVQVDLLMLTSLGAWMNSRGAWEHPEKLGAVFSLEEWRHRMTMGRDNYVRIVDKGFLLPFGHRAAKIKVTERKFVQSPSGGMCAYLRKREFIVVRQPIKQYPVMGDKVNGRLLPFKLVQCKTLVTPTLGDPTKTSVPGVQDAAFWPQVGGVDFQFHFAAEDWEGKHSEFTCPIIFVKAGAAYDRILMDKIRDHYHAGSNDSRRHTDMAGQKVAYAASSKSGDTTYETNACNFGVGTIDQCFIDPAFKAKLQDENQPAFYPAMISADVKIAAIQQLVGNNSTAAIEYHGVYVKSGLGGAANKGEVFAKLKEPVSLTYGGSVEKTAGVVSPNISIGGLSRSLGAIGGTADTVAGGTFDPGDFFSGAKILGSIPLESIVRELNFASVGGGKVPKLSTELIHEKGQLPTAVEAKFSWETSELVKDPTGLFLAECNGKKSSLSVNAVRRTQLDGKDSTYSITSELSNFTIDLLPAVQSLVQVRFNKLKFVSETGRKADVEADIDKVVFKGPLSFINKLEEFIKGAGFSDPPYLDVTADHVKAGYTLAIPTVGVGVFSLQNIALDASLNLPFIGDPVSMRFAFCERQNPFILTVSMFGGGGFFGMELDPGGVKVIEGSLEFGGSFSLNLGIASGGIYLMGGISYARNNGLNELGGYVRCGGALSVLGLITVSMEFYLGLKHYEDPSRMYGKCTMTVEIEILFFSKSVDLTVEREFGGGGDPTFADLMDRNSWNSYCEAFA